MFSLVPSLLLPLGPSVKAAKSEPALRVALLAAPVVPNSLLPGLRRFPIHLLRRPLRLVASERSDKRLSARRFALGPGFLDETASAHTYRDDFLLWTLPLLEDSRLAPFCDARSAHPLISGV